MDDFDTVDISAEVNQKMSDSLKIYTKAIVKPLIPLCKT